MPHLAHNKNSMLNDLNPIQGFIIIFQESGTNPPRSRSQVPPLARGRGMSTRVRTPTEERRYVSFCQYDYDSSANAS